MKHAHPETNPVLRTARWLVYASVLTAAFLITMGIAYTVVLRSGHAEMHKQPNPADSASEAEILEDLRREMKGLTHELSQRASVERTPPSESYSTWTTEDFLPRLNGLRRKIQSAPLSGDSLSALLAVSDRVAAWSKRPADEQLRTSASDAMVSAEDAVDQRVGALRAGLAM